MSIAEQIAQAFHSEYEAAAPVHGYETRKASAVDWPDVPEANRALMVATVQALLDTGVIEPGADVLRVARHRCTPECERGAGHDWRTA